MARGRPALDRRALVAAIAGGAGLPGSCGAAQPCPTSASPTTIPRRTAPRRRWPRTPGQPREFLSRPTRTSSGAGRRRRFRDDVGRHPREDAVSGPLVILGSRSPGAAGAAGRGGCAGGSRSARSVIAILALGLRGGGRAAVAVPGRLRPPARLAGDPNARAADRLSPRWRWRCSRRREPSGCSRRRGVRGPRAPRRGGSRRCWRCGRDRGARPAVRPDRRAGPAARAGDPAVRRRGVPAPQLHLPAERPEDNRRYLLWSTDGFPKIVNGRSSTEPAVHRESDRGHARLPGRGDRRRAAPRSASPRWSSISSATPAPPRRGSSSGRSQASA